MWRVALLQVLRDRRRSGATIIAMAVAVFGLAMFLAYVVFVERTLAAIVIYHHVNGHVQVYRRDGLARAATAPAQFSLSRNQYSRVAAIAGQLPGFVLATPQLEGSGIVQHDARTEAFLARGVIPEDEERIREAGRRLLETGVRDDANRLASDPGGVLVTSKLRRVLQVPAGTSSDTILQLSTSAFDRRLNVIEASIAGEFATGVEETEGKSLKMSLPLMQDLYRTDGATRLVILLSDRRQVSGFAAELRRRLAADRVDADVYTWDDPQIGRLYASFISFFATMFALCGLVMVVLCTLTIQSTMLMGYFDRIRELGALRAIGFGRNKLAGLFARESVILCALGAAAGMGLAAATGTAITAAHLETTLPRVSTPVPVALFAPVPAMLGIIAALSIVVSASTVILLRRKLRAPITYCLQGRFASVAVLITLLAGWGTGMRAYSNAEPDDQQLASWLRTSDRARGGFGSYTWDLEISSHDGGDTTTTSYRVDVRDDKAVATAVSPSSIRGETILLLGRAMWFTKPGLRRPVSISPRQRLMGQAANGDIASIQYSDNYAATLAGEQLVGEVRTYKLQLKARNDKMTYDHVIYYLDQRTRLAIAADLLTPSGQLYRHATMEYGNRVELDGTSTPFISTMTIADAHFPDRQTILTYTNVKPVQHSAARFTLAGLVP